MYFIEKQCKCWKKFSEFTDLDFELTLKDSLAETEVADVLMDMSSPKFFEEIVKYCKSKKGSPNFGFHWP